MIDRIEELLGSLAAEDEEEQEDVLTQKRGKAVSEGAWTGARASDGASGPRDQPEWSGKRPSTLTALQRDNGAAKPCVANRRSVPTDKRETEDRRDGQTAEKAARSRPAPIIEETGDGGWTVGKIVLDRSGLIAGDAEDGGTRDRRGGSVAGETAAERAETAGALWKVGPVWTVRGVEPKMDEAQRVVTAERTVQAEDAVQTAWNRELVWAGLERTVRGGLSPATESTARSGLEGLYRRTVQGLRPAAPALPSEQAGRIVRAQEPGSAVSLAVDELDRAVRRDSRRYDGGMSIY